MTVKELDFLFPFLVFAYGLTVTLILQSPGLVELAEKRLPPSLWNQFKAHGALAFICLIVGAGWSLQNLWFQGS